MKKIAGIILSLCVLLSALSVNVFAAEEVTTEDPHEETRGYTEAFNKQLSKGDITGDSKVTTEDASEYLKVAAKLKAPKENVNYEVLKNILENNEEKDLGEALWYISEMIGMSF